MAIPVGALPTGMLPMFAQSVVRSTCTTFVDWFVT